MRDVLHHREVMADKEERNIEVSLQIKEEIED